ncbi:tryptophan 7-halogenase [Sinorhizobium kostiense]|uniref:tryptophan 7-halogenase n=1 Tax=Sinorhizobium kostiense TaxID=76747 RepID=UPI001F3EF5BF|nr:tryptophan 7-halogenase [Sinorhizobium kostiense]
MPSTKSHGRLNTPADPGAPPSWRLCLVAARRPSHGEPRQPDVSLTVRRIGIFSGGIVGWLAAIAPSRVFDLYVDVTVIETAALFPLGPGEGACS